MSTNECAPLAKDLLISLTCGMANSTRASTHAIAKSGRCVAKTAFRGSVFATQVLREAIERPLFVTARGIEPEQAARLLKEMHGEHCIPTLIKRVDQLARASLA